MKSSTNRQILAAFLGMAALNAAAAGKPNILFITANDMNFEGEGRMMKIIVRANRLPTLDPVESLLCETNELISILVKSIQTAQRKRKAKAT